MRGMKRQTLFSVSTIVAAVLVVVWLMGRERALDVDGGVQEHDHGAATPAAGEREPVRLTAEGARRIGVTFAVAERRTLPAAVEAVGTVTWDERRLVTVAPRVEGWVERLHADFTGAPVRQGRTLMEIYSPDLVSAQEELILAARLVREAGPEGPRAENARELLASARRRLDFWDIGVDVVQEVEQTGEPRRTVPIRSPITGIVIEKNVVQGERVMSGATAFRIADLSLVWIEVDVFERDLALVGVGRTATVSFEAYPDRADTARVTYVHPTVSLATRTARVRLELANPDLTIRPGMFANVRIEGRAEEPTVVVPRSAVLETGERSLVFVRAPDGSLVARQVRTGRASGRLQGIREGLAEGETVVSSAAFLVDAESNLGAAAMPGMEMGAPPGGTPGEDSGSVPAMDGDREPPRDSTLHQGHGG